MSLEEDFDECLAYANFLIEQIEAMDSVERVGGASIELSRYYRALGICELMVDCDVDAFFQFLLHGALTRRFYLEWCARDGVLGLPEQRASILEPVFDALAANEAQLASRLLDLSSDSTCREFEDDIDFTFSRVLKALSSFDDRALGVALDQYETALDGEDDARLDVCRALSARDETALARALDRLIDSHQEQMQALEVSIRSKENTFAPNCVLFVEGLAYLRLADRLGIPTRPEFLLCPSVARRMRRKPFVPESFPQLPL